MLVGLIIEVWSWKSLLGPAHSQGTGAGQYRFSKLGKWNFKKFVCVCTVCMCIPVIGGLVQLIHAAPNIHILIDLSDTNVPQVVCVLSPQQVIDLK